MKSVRAVAVVMLAMLAFGGCGAGAEGGPAEVTTGISVVRLSKTGSARTSLVDSCLQSAAGNSVPSSCQALGALCPRLHFLGL